MQIFAPNYRKMSPHMLPPLRASTLTSPPPLPPNIVGCWVLWSIGSHLRPEPNASLYFLMLLHLVPQTRQPTMASANPTPRASCPGPIEGGGTKSQGCDGCCHGDRGQSSWRVGQRWLILALWVVGCGLWVVGCVVGLRVLVSYNTHFVHQPGKLCPPPYMLK